MRYAYHADARRGLVVAKRIRRADRAIGWAVIIVGLAGVIALPFDRALGLYWIHWMWSWNWAVSCNRSWWGRCPMTLGAWYCSGLLDLGDSDRMDLYIVRLGARRAWGRLCRETAGIAGGCVAVALGIWWITWRAFD